MLYIVYRFRFGYSSTGCSSSPFSLSYVHSIRALQGKGKGPDGHPYSVTADNKGHLIKCGLSKRALVRFLWNQAKIYRMRQWFSGIRWDAGEKLDCWGDASRANPTIELLNSSYSRREVWVPEPETGPWSSTVQKCDNSSRRKPDATQFEYDTSVGPFFIPCHLLRVGKLNFGALRCLHIE